MRRLVCAALMLAAAGAAAQQLATPSRFNPAPEARTAGGDPAETAMIAETAGAGSFQQWYAGQRQPAVVVYFDRKLAELPPGWEGSSRLLVEDKRQEGGKETSRRLTVGFEQNTVQARRVSQFAQLFQLAIEQELKRERVRVLDGAVLQRKESFVAKSGDLEYGALKRSARFVFEVELLSIGGQWELSGVLKDLHSGDVTASVRLPVRGLDAQEALARASRQLVQRLMQYKVA